MSPSRKPRSINLSKASGHYKGRKLPKGFYKTAQRPAASPSAAQNSRPRPTPNTAQNTAAQRVVRPSESAPKKPRTAAPAAAASATQMRGKRKKKVNAQRIAVLIIAILLLIVLGVYLAIQMIGKSIVNTGDMGTLDSLSGTGVEKPPEFNGKQLNLLVLGIDYSSEDAIVRDPIGQTDMILYCQFDFEKNQLKMLQIPRDTYVGEIGGTAGKINGVFSTTSDSKNRVAAVARVIEENLKLPVDNYVTIDMDALRAIVDLFGGIDIEVPYDMKKYNEKTGVLERQILAGPTRLNGEDLEFFLRFRDLPRGDIDRLENQRQFYAAIFKVIRTASVGDLVKLVPVAAKYINSDLSVNDLIGIAINVLKISDGNILMCKMPTYGGSGLYKGTYSVIVCAKEETATLLNKYFFTEGYHITAGDITFEHYPHDGGLYPANEQWMGEHIEETPPEENTEDISSSGSTPADAAA